MQLTKLIQDSNKLTGESKVMNIKMLPQSPTAIDLDLLMPPSLIKLSNYQVGSHATNSNAMNSIEKELAGAPYGGSHDKNGKKMANDQISNLDLTELLRQPSFFNNQKVLDVTGISNN